MKKAVELVKSIVEKTHDNKKKADEKTLENRQNDQMKKQAIIEIEKIATALEQKHVETLGNKYKRTLDLKLQLDKLEKRLVENMPPPSLNIFIKLEFHAYAKRT